MTLISLTGLRQYDLFYYKLNSIPCFTAGRPQDRMAVLTQITRS